MPTKAELKQKSEAALLAAKAICAKAEGEGRDFTPQERTEVQAYLEIARSVREQLAALDAKAKDQKAQDADMMKAILELGAGEPTSRGVWSVAFLKGLGVYRPAIGQKELMPVSGSVTVGQLSSTIGTLADDQRADTVLQLIPIEPASGDAFSYLRETRRTHAAEPVEPGELKPTSVYTLERIDDRIRTIAHLSEPISRNWLSDAPMLSRYIDNVLREGCALELEYQVFQGSGTGEELPGILNAAGVLTQAFVTDVLTTARRAITALELQPVAPTGWAIHPSDWETLELVTATTGEYLLKNGVVMPPVDRAKRQLWGLPVALTLGLPEGTAVLAAWPTAVTLLEREKTRIDWSEAFHVPAGAYDSRDHSGFESNEVKFRGELRYGFSINRPGAICLIEFSTGS